MLKQITPLSLKPKLPFISKAVISLMGVALATSTFLPVVTLNWHCRAGAVKCVSFEGSQSFWGLSENINTWDTGAVNGHAFLLISAGSLVLLFAVTSVLRKKWLRMLAVLFLMLLQIVILLDISSFIAKWLPYGCSQGFTQFDFKNDFCSVSTSINQGFYLMEVLMVVLVIGMAYGYPEQNRYIRNGN